MPMIRHHAAIRALVAVRGHAFDRSAFDAIFQAMDGISATMVDQPAAALLMNPEGMADFDALVLYDMPGLDFEAGEGTVGYLDPSPRLREGFAALLEQGKGVVALHHAIAGWPTWAEYHDWLGGQFFYLPGTFRGRAVPDSGYAHDVTYEVEVLADHPVTAGVSPRFTLTDEPYLAQIAPIDAVPLLRARHGFVRDNFYSTLNAVRGTMHSREGWEHPQGSDLIGWARTIGEARIVTLQPGDGPSAYENPDYRRLVENAIRWVAKA